MALFWTSVQQSARSSSQQVTTSRQKPEATSCNSSSGSQRTRRSTKCLQATPRSSREIARDIKEIFLHCFRLRQSPNRLRKAQTKRIPTSSQTETSALSAPNVSVVRTCCFSQGFIGKEPSGIHDTSFQSIMKYDADIRKNFYANVVLLGGIVTSPAHLKHDGEGVDVGSVNSFALSAEPLSWLS